MKIIDKRGQLRQTFGNIEEGEVFIWASVECLKIEPVSHHSEIVNAVALYDGKFYSIDDDDKVCPVKSTLIIE